LAAALAVTKGASIVTQCPVHRAPISSMRPFCSAHEVAMRPLSRPVRAMMTGALLIAPMGMRSG
jgi:hypothetical protein